MFDNIVTSCFLNIDLSVCVASFEKETHEVVYFGLSNCAAYLACDPLDLYFICVGAFRNIKNDHFSCDKTIYDASQCEWTDDASEEFTFVLEEAETQSNICDTPACDDNKIASCDKKAPYFYDFKVISQNKRGLKDPLKLECAIDQMTQNRADAFFIQETWLKGDVFKVSRGHTIFLWFV